MKPRSKYLLALALSMPALLSVRPAGADQPPASTEVNPDREAKKHYRTAISHFDRGEYPKALEEFKAAYELSPNFRILYNLSLVHFELKDYAAAHRSLSRYLSEARDGLPGEERQALVMRLEQLETKLGALIITSEVAKARVTVDEEVLGDAALADAVYVAPGEHVVTANFPDGTSETKKVAVLLGEQRKVTFAPQEKAELPSHRPPAPARAPAPRKQAAEASAFPYLPWIATATLAAGATTMGLLTLDQRNQEQLIQSERGVEPDDLEQARSNVERMALATDILIGAAVVGAAVSSYMTFEWSSDSERRRRAEIRPSLRGVSVRTTF